MNCLIRCGTYVLLHNSPCRAVLCFQTQFFPWKSHRRRTWPADSIALLNRPQISIAQPTLSAHACKSALFIFMSIRKELSERLTTSLLLLILLIIIVMETEYRINIQCLADFYGTSLPSAINWYEVFVTSVSKSQIHILFFPMCKTRNHLKLSTKM